MPTTSPEGGAPDGPGRRDPSLHPTHRQIPQAGGRFVVLVDRERCVGAGQCVLAAADVFDQAPEDGRVLLLDHAPGADHADGITRAAHDCPSGAITVTARDST
ncbi:ferredoxin [Yinghuangia sp. YIM S09857]|uniref:ferredoxin n=1 Tax=Yinghuangia sp. YIM S09857 TaxID=3436929 RepID=UPI003F532432